MDAGRLSNLALRVIYDFRNFHIEYKNHDKLKDHIKFWITLPKNIKKSYHEDMPFWLCSFLRKYDNVGIRKRMDENKRKSEPIPNFSGFKELNIAISQFPDYVLKDKKLFNTWCDDYHIYGTKHRIEIFNTYQNLY